MQGDQTYFKPLEEALIKHVDTIQHLYLCWIPVKVLSYLMNLISLEVDCIIYPYYATQIGMIWKIYFYLI